MRYLHYRLEPVRLIEARTWRSDSCKMGDTEKNCQPEDTNLETNYKYVLMIDELKVEKTLKR